MHYGYQKQQCYPKHCWDWTGLFFGRNVFKYACTTAAQPVAKYDLGWVLFRQQLSEKFNVY